MFALSLAHSLALSDSASIAVSFKSLQGLDSRWIAQIVRTETREDSAARRFTAYVMHVTYGSEKWQIARRFSEFLQLHQLRVCEKFAEAALPAFPTRSLLSSLFGFDPDERQVLERRAVLQNYLNVLLTDAKFLAVRPALGAFLQPTPADRRERVNESSRSLLLLDDVADADADTAAHPVASSSSSWLHLPAPPPHLLLPRVFRVTRRTVDSSSSSSSSSSSLRLIDTETLHPDWLIAQLKSTLDFVAAVQRELASVRGAEAKLTVLQREEARLNGAENNLREQRASFQAMLDEPGPGSSDALLNEYLLVCVQHVEMALQWRAESLKAALANLGRGEKDEEVQKLAKRFELRCDAVLIAVFTAPSLDGDSAPAAPSQHRSSSIAEQAKQLALDVEAEQTHLRDLLSLGQVTQAVFNDVRERLSHVAEHTAQLRAVLSGGSIQTASMFAEIRLSSFEQQLYALLSDVDANAAAERPTSPPPLTASAPERQAPPTQLQLQARIDQLAKDLAHYRRMLQKERAQLQTDLYHETLKLQREQSGQSDEARRAAEATREALVQSRRQAEDLIDRRIEECMENVEEVRYLFNKRFGLDGAQFSVAASADRVRQGEVTRTHAQRQDQLFEL
jgi:hypothetical protein